MATDLELGPLVGTDGMSFEDIGSQQSSNLSSRDVVEVSAEAKPDPYLRVYVPLMNAASKGDCQKAAKIIHDEGEAVLLVSIPQQQGETVLHVAARAGHVRLMRELLKLLPKEDLAVTDDEGNTALMSAAAAGKVRVAEIMVLQNPILPEKRDKKRMTALHFAASHGHGEMALYLYPITKHILSTEDGVVIYFSCINTDLYGLALALLRDHPELAVARNSEGQTALHLLARKPSIFAIKRSSGIWKKYVSTCIYYKRNPGSSFLSFLLEIQRQDDPQKIKDLLALPSPVLHLAAEAGNLEFSAALIEFYPALVYQKNESKQNFLHIAAKHHQLGMFSLVDKFPGFCIMGLMRSQDDDNNNILHFAAMLPPPNGLDAMLQMKRDQNWFKNFQKVMKLVPAEYLKMRNSEGKTPFDILREARDEGLFPSQKSWLVNVANMSTIVSTFIAVAFAFGWFPSHESEHNC